MKHTISTQESVFTFHSTVYISLLTFENVSSTLKHPKSNASDKKRRIFCHCLQKPSLTTPERFLIISVGERARLKDANKFEILYLALPFHKYSKTNLLDIGSL